MFSIYKKGMEVNPAGYPLNYTFLFDDTLYDDPPENVQNFIGSLTDCMLKCDEYFGNTQWQFKTGLIYNSNNWTAAIHKAIQALKTFYPTAVGIFKTDDDPVTSVVRFKDGTMSFENTFVGAGQNFQYAYSEGNPLYNPCGGEIVTAVSGDGTQGYFQISFSVCPVKNWNNSTGKFVFENGDMVREFTIGVLDNNNGTYLLSIVSNVQTLIATEYVSKYNGTEGTRQPVPDNDPYSDDDDTGGSSGDGGGGDTGEDNYSDDSDPNPVPNLPSLTAVDTGFITLYTPTKAQLQALASYMWGSLFDITTWKKVLADPMDAIIGLSIVPVNVPSSGASAVTVGNIATGISLNKASAQFIEIDCGTVTITEKWKAYLDYSPYTRVSIFLPFIGSQELDVDLIQSTTLGVKYHIDILSGACVAFITTNGNVIAQFSGQCAVSIPITSKDFTQTIMALGSLVASGVGVVASGGMSAPVSGAMIAGGVTALANTANNVISGKPTFAKSGNMSGSNGLMGSRKPYIIIERPKQCAPARQNTFTGYPSYVTRGLGTLSGFTQVQNIHLDGIPCMDAERDEILQLLREGVIL